VATETKDKAPQSWLGGNEYNPAELIKTYEVDASIEKSSIVAYYSRELNALGWRAGTGTTVTAPDAGFCKLPNLAAYISLPPHRGTRTFCKMCQPMWPVVPNREPS